MDYEFDAGSRRTGGRTLGGGRPAAGSAAECAAGCPSLPRLLLNSILQMVFSQHCCACRGCRGGVSAVGTACSNTLGSPHARRSAAQRRIQRAAKTALQQRGAGGRGNQQIQTQTQTWGHLAPRQQGGSSSVLSLFGFRHGFRCWGGALKRCTCAAWRQQTAPAPLHADTHAHRAGLGRRGVRGERCGQKQMCSGALAWGGGGERCGVREQRLTPGPAPSAALHAAAGARGGRRVPACLAVW